MTLWGDLAPGESLNAAFENSERGLGNTDYFDLHYKNYSFKHNHNLSFSGGSKKAQYYVSGGYYNEDGILRYADMDYTRYTVNANITSELTKWLKLKFTLSLCIRIIGLLLIMKIRKLDLTVV